MSSMSLSKICGIVIVMLTMSIAGTAYDGSKCPCLSGMRTLDSIWAEYVDAQTQSLIGLGEVSVTFSSTSRCQGRPGTAPHLGQTVVEVYEMVIVHADSSTDTVPGRLDLVTLYNFQDTGTLFCRTNWLQYDPAQSELVGYEEKLFLTEDEFDACQRVITNKKYPACPVQTP